MQVVPPYAIVLTDQDSTSLNDGWMPCEFDIA